MSIIEKAASRLNQQAKIPPARSVPVSPPVLVQAQALPSTPADEVEPSQAADYARENIPSPNRFDIDLLRLQQMGLVTPETGRTAIAEEFRLIKRPIIEKAFSAEPGSKKRGNLIMVTSAMPGEGKTFCSVNLAMSIAMELDHTVLLVDADVARPSVPRYLGLEAEQGLLDLLHNPDLDVRDVMYSTNVERLRVLPAGRSNRRATELLASQAMSRLLEELASRYPDRIIIFDSPPVLLTSEARALASQMGQIVMVVEAEGTTQRGLKEALRQIGSNDNVNLIYNKAQAFPGTRYYGGYY
ncbi:exopolysaccharide/PEP-CTERM locus tyrosine autokinase [Noviherbaspirillum humi]|uniref:non-specific protein-tyrosine kinase n=1 Tax=Noviherbaspirillum humi TaxID=1688639 RepID=A0A239HM78_9BURK|nr:XrtA-associated tyrosine autokinase [Noviherbaspirillum humi]SNS81364.1 exopolysaccharide/PEP-CTERM locus tyrosine autokinase [Noviherbaspirillum humi]